MLSEEVPHLAHGATESDEVDHYVGRVASILARRCEVTAPDLATSATVVVTTIDSLTRWLVHAMPPELEPSTYIREVVRMLVGYLQPGVAAQSTSSSGR